MLNLAVELDLSSPCWLVLGVAIDSGYGHDSRLNEKFADQIAAMEKVDEPELVGK